MAAVTAPAAAPASAPVTVSTDVLKLVFDKVESSPMPFFIKPIARGIAQKVKRALINPQLQLHLDYLEEREMVRIDKDPMDRWTVDLTRTGIDFVEYTIDAQPGISRPTITQV